MPPFLGSDFYLQSVEPLGLATLRVRFTQDPKAIDEGAPDDALNANNYVLTGPAENFVTGTSIVDEDPQAIDLYLIAPLVVGEWTLKVDEAIISVENKPFIEPREMNFQVTFVATQEDPSGGAINDSYENIIRKHLNPALRGKGWEALIAAVATGDRFLGETAAMAFDQQYLVSASGKYLDRKGADVGIRRPGTLGMSDDDYRKLVTIATTRKLTQEAILEMMEVFYGSESVRAYIDTNAGEPYALNDNDTLELLFNEKLRATIPFERKMFAKIGQATAHEVTVAINRELKNQHIKGEAVVIKDPVTAETRVRIFSGAYGAVSSIRVLGGRSQTDLRFGQEVFQNVAFTPISWTITQVNGRIRFETDDFFNLSKVRIGDYVVIAGSNFKEKNLDGWFPILDVHYEYIGTTKIQWFEIDNPEGDPANLTQLLYRDVQFFRPIKRVVADERRRVTLSQTEGQVHVEIPATTKVVGRDATHAAYLHVSPSSSIVDLTRLNAKEVRVGTSSPHGLQAGDVVIIDNAYPFINLPQITQGIVTPPPPAPPDGGTLRFNGGFGAFPPGSTADIFGLGDGVSSFIYGQWVEWSIFPGDTVVVQPVLDIANVNTQGFTLRWISEMSGGQLLAEWQVPAQTGIVTLPPINVPFHIGSRRWHWRAHMGVGSGNTSAEVHINMEIPAVSIPKTFTELALDNAGTARTSMATPSGSPSGVVRMNHRVVPLKVGAGDWRAMVIGGEDELGNRTGQCELWSLVHGGAPNPDATKTIAASRPFPTSKGMACTAADGSVFAVVHEFIPFNPSPFQSEVNTLRLYKYEYNTDTWTAQITQTNAAPSDGAMITMKNGDILMVGRNRTDPGGGFGIEQFTYIYRPSANYLWQTIQQVELNPPFGTFVDMGAYRAKVQMALANLPNGNVLMSGGRVSNNGITQASAIYDPYRNVWTQIASMNQIRCRHTLTSLPNGKVLAVGGYATQGGSPSFTPGPGTNTAELFDPSTNTWTTVPSTMSVGRDGHQAFYVPQLNKVVIIGGEPTGTATGVVELYDPLTNTFSTSFSVPPRRFSAGCYFPSGTQYSFITVGGQDPVTGLATDTVSLFAS